MGAIRGLFLDWLRFGNAVVMRLAKVAGVAELVRRDPHLAAVVARVRGMFALAWWDDRERELLLEPPQQFHM